MGMLNDGDYGCGNLPKDEQGNILAPDGRVFVCLACGKLSKDLYGFHKISRGWDESCMLNCRLYLEDELEILGDVVAKIKSTKGTR